VVFRPTGLVRGLSRNHGAGSQSVSLTVDGVGMDLQEFGKAFKGLPRWAQVCLVLFTVGLLNGVLATLSRPRTIAAPRPTSAACARALPLIEQHCRLSVTMSDCRESTRSSHVLMDRQVQKLGAGAFVSVPWGPEWFLSATHGLVPINGLAKGPCDRDLPDPLALIAATDWATAPVRGTSAKTYEGVYGPKGDYLNPDCSRFEMEVGAVVHRELFRDPEEDEDLAIGRAAKLVQLPRKTAQHIYFKAGALCPEAMRLPPSATR
jgi:hypothetical protein